MNTINCDTNKSIFIYKINRNDKGIDHYKLNHGNNLSNLIERVDDRFGNNKIFFVGSGYNGISVPDSIISGKDIAYKLSQKESLFHIKQEIL